MKIKQVTWQHRFDFEAILECEHCDSTQLLKTGYDDSYYHNKVLPSVTCIKCKKDRSGKITDQDSQGTKSV
jgi:hypothetical protein